MEVIYGWYLLRTVLSEIHCLSPLILSPLTKAVSIPLSSITNPGVIVCAPRVSNADMHVSVGILTVEPRADAC